MNLHEGRAARGGVPRVVNPMMALPALIDGEGPILFESLVGGTERAWGKSHSLKRLLLAHRSTSTQTLKVRFCGILDFG